jgi:SAM-dependent methyltransferase
MDAPDRCLICQSPDAAPLLKARDHLTGDDFQVFLCKQCDGAFTTPVPENLERYYPPSYRDYQPRSRRIFEFMYRLQTRRWSRDIGAPGYALEIGCGHGWMLNALRSHGWRVCGTERNPASARFATKELHLPVVVGDLSDPQEMLRQCAERLKDSGTLIVAVPNRASWQFRASGAQWFHLDVPRHLSHFTPACLERICASAGLRVARIAYVSLDQDPFGWMVSFLNCMGFPQTRWLHWLAGRDRELSFKNVAMFLLSPLLLLAGFLLAPASWLARAGACMEVYIVKAAPRAE